MSFYTFATGSLTTTRDRNRHAAVNKGQIARTVILCLVMAVVLLVMFHQQSHAAEPGFRSFVPGPRSQAQSRGGSRGTFDQPGAPLHTSWPVAAR